MYNTQNRIRVIGIPDLQYTEGPLTNPIRGDRRRATPCTMRKVCMGARRTSPQLRGSLRQVPAQVRYKTGPGYNCRPRGTELVKFIVLLGMRYP